MTDKVVTITERNGKAPGVDIVIQRGARRITRAVVPTEDGLGWYCVNPFVLDVSAPRFATKQEAIDAVTAML